MDFEKELGGKLLESVSRSFALSLRALPGEVRGTVSLAYLLARAADTLADTEAVAAGVRGDLLAELAGSVAGGGGLPGGFGQRLSDDFIPHQEHAGEAELLRRSDDLIAWLSELEEADAGMVRTVLAEITQGQVEDVARFGDPGGEGDGVTCLGTEEELDRYTYQVAGSVGAFWTEVCVRNVRGFLAEGREEEEMRGRGVRFGKGLQLINILRDLPEDLAAGRCYLPSSELGDEGVRPGAILAAMPKWMGRCRDHLGAGLEYCEGVGHRRAGLATALPLMLAGATLRELERATGRGWEAVAAKVKIGRGEVAALTAKTTLAAGRPKKLRRLFEKVVEG